MRARACKVLSYSSMYSSSCDVVVCFLMRMAKAVARLASALAPFVNGNLKSVMQPPVDYPGNQNMLLFMDVEKLRLRLRRHSADRSRK